MKRRRLLPRRSVTEWCIRGALSVVALGLAYISVRHSVAESVKRYSPVYAHQLAPDNGSITALLAQQQFAAKPTARQTTVAMARLALQQDPTAIPAVTTLGFQLQLGGDALGARRLFAYSGKLSRRDLETHIWAIENAVSRGDVRTALSHYDLALRTSITAPDLLFPVLSQAVNDPTVRHDLATVLRQKPSWGSSFLTYLAGSKVADSSAIADLVLRMKRFGLAPSPEAAAAATNGLVSTGAFDAAWRFYTALHPQADHRRSRDPRFSDDIATPSVFDWNPVENPAYSVSLQRDRAGGLFDFSAPPSVDGSVLTQMQLLPAGAYRLTGHSIGIQQPRRSAPYWTLTCRDGRELGHVEVPNSSEANGTFGGRFTVPAGCPVQTLSFVLRPSDEVSGSSGQIDRVQIFPG